MGGFWLYGGSGYKSMHARTSKLHIMMKAAEKRSLWEVGRGYFGLDGYLGDDFMIAFGQMADGEGRQCNDEGERKRA